MIHIAQCRFMHNRCSERQSGIAIHHSSQNRAYVLTINGCKFNDNRVGASVVHFEKAENPTTCQ